MDHVIDAVQSTPHCVGLHAIDATLPRVDGVNRKKFRTRRPASKLMGARAWTKISNEAGARHRQSMRTRGASISATAASTATATTAYTQKAKSSAAVVGARPVGARPVGARRRRRADRRGCVVPRLHVHEPRGGVQQLRESVRDLRQPGGVVRHAEPTPPGWRRSRTDSRSC